MTVWHGDVDNDQDLPERVRLNKAELSWQTWELMQITDWKHLPYSGGLLEQPDWLIQDLLTISALSGRVKKTIKNE